MLDRAWQQTLVGLTKFNEPFTIAPENYRRRNAYHQEVEDTVDAEQNGRVLCKIKLPTCLGNGKIVMRPVTNVQDFRLAVGGQCKAGGYTHEVIREVGSDTWEVSISHMMEEN